MGNPYLILYNTALFFGWSACFVLTWKTLLEGGSKADVWEAVEVPLKISQTAAVLEIVHAAIGLVRSPVMVTATQVASRIWLLWGIMVPVLVPTTQGSIPLLKVGDTQLELSIVSLFTAWSLSEMVRYSFYAFKELGAVPYASTWLRYTSFIVLYPLGVSSELALVLLALPTIKATGMWSLDMPNALNFAFDYYIFCIIGMLVYLPGFPQLYMYMLTQRKKVLGTKPKAA